MTDGVGLKVRKDARSSISLLIWVACRGGDRGCCYGLQAVTLVVLTVLRLAESRIRPCMVHT